MSVQTSGLVSLPVGDVEIVKGFNPRRTFDADALAELAASIKADGIIEPLIVRCEGKAAKLVAGERRLRAAKLAGLKEVPCLVRELTESEALRLAVLENLQRVDVSAIEEAEGFQRLITSKEFTADTLAKKLGKSREHIYGRLRLLKLDASVTQALAKGDIDASAAGLLAKFAPPLQKQVLQKLHASCPRNFLEAKETIQESFRPLTSAPWLSGKKLSEKWDCGAPLLCFECPHNSANMPDMAGLSAKPVCLDSACYQRKHEEHGRLKLDQAKAAGTPVVELGKNDWSYDGESLGYGSTYRAADAKDYDLPDVKGKYATWREVLKGTGYVFPVTLSPNGTLLELVKPSEARALLIKAGKLEPKPNAGKDATKEERAAVIKENKLKRAATEKLAEACLAAVAKLDDATFWPLLCWHADLDWRWKGTLAESLGIKSEGGCEDLTEQLHAAAAKLPAAERRQKLLRADLWRRQEWCETIADNWAKLLGVGNEAPATVETDKIIAEAKAAWAARRAKVTE